MNRIALSVGALVGLFACDPGEELRETGAMEGAWAGRWAASGRFIRTPQRSTPIELEFESSELVRGIVRDQSFELASRRELFDGRHNGQVYDEGDGLYRTSFETDEAFYDLGFMLDGSGRRALVASFGTTVGVLQRIETIPDPEIATPPSGSWEGRMIALDNDNVDEANARRSAVTLECTETSCQGTRGNTAFSLTLTEVGGSVWAGSVQGLSPGDEGTQVRVVVGPDGDLLALSFCADDIGAAGFYCAYVALERRSSS